MSLTLITPPAIEPVSLYEMKRQCGFSPVEDLDKVRSETLAEELRSAITAARQDCENITGRAFITQAWTLKLNHFPRYSDQYLVHNRMDIRLPLPKFGALTAFSYMDYAGVLQDNMVPGVWGYQLVSGGDTTQERLRPPIGRIWPVTRWYIADAVTISFTCGYGDTAASVPATIRQAIKLNAKWFYDGCEGPQPPAVKALLSTDQILIV